jgi:hypothetical protein
MLHVEDMKNKVYSFARFYEPSKIQDAVRILLSAGIPRDHIRILSPTSTAERSSLTTPDAKRLALKGGLWGALAGLLLGTLIFLLPKYIWDYPYESGLAVVGMVLFLGVGISVGVL